MSSHPQYAHSNNENSKFIRLVQTKFVNDRMDTDSLSPSSQTSTLSSATASTPLPSSSSSQSQSPPPTATSMSLRAADDFIRSSSRTVGHFHHQQPVQESVLSSSSSSSQRAAKSLIRNPFRTSDLEAFLDCPQAGGGSSSHLTPSGGGGVDRRNNRSFVKCQPDNNTPQFRRLDLKRRSNQHEIISHEYHRRHTVVEPLVVSTTTSTGGRLPTNATPNVSIAAPTSSTYVKKKSRSAGSSSSYISGNNTRFKTADYDDANAKFKDFSIDSLLKSD